MSSIHEYTPARIVYQSDAVTLWHGDALGVLPTIEKESTGLILTDPPYGVEWQSNRCAESFGMLLGDGRDDRDGTVGSAA